METRLPQPFTRTDTQNQCLDNLEGESSTSSNSTPEAAAITRSVVGYFARQLLKDLRLVGGYDLLCRVKTPVDTSSRPSSTLPRPSISATPSRPRSTASSFDNFRKAINALTIRDSGPSRIEGHIRLRDTRPFRTEPRAFLPAKKSVFNRIVGEAHAGSLELDFAAFLESATDVQSHAKNYLAIGFRLDYVKADGELSNYTPDFVVRTTDGAAGSSRPRAARNSTCHKRWPACVNGAPTPPPPATAGATASSTSTKPAFDDTRRGRSRRSVASFREYQEG